MSPIPVILDTDIGGDIDDTWALIMLLNSPELDLKLVTAASGDTTYRARLAARILQDAGRGDVPVGVGLNTHGRDRQLQYSQRPYVAGYNLDDYPGTVHEDGVQALIDTVKACEQPPTIIAIGPCTNVAAALERAPEIAGLARFVGMQGSLHWEHEGRPGAIAEYNVIVDIPACQATFRADWPITFTPLDSCGFIRLSGDHYRRVRESTAPGARLVMDNYAIWAEYHGRQQDFEHRSSILYDTVAIYLAIAEEYLKIEDLPITVRDDGFTVIDEEHGRMMRVATEWRDLESFIELLTERITR